MRAVLLFVAAGCPSPAPSDGAVPDAPLPPFGAPVRIAELALPNFESDATLASDQLEIYFKRDDATTGFNIWSAQRTTATERWGTPAIATALSTATEDDVAPRLTSDGLTMYLDRGALGIGEGSAYVATRPARGAPWSTPTAVTIPIGAPIKSLIVPDPAQLVGYLDVRVTPTTSRIYRTTRASLAAPWSTPVELTELTSGGFDDRPWVSADERTIVFSSDRSGNYELYMAHRSAPGAPFDTPELLAELASPAWDTDPWLSPDLRTIVFGSNRTGDFDLYQAQR